MKKRLLIGRGQCRAFYFVFTKGFGNKNHRSFGGIRQDGLESDDGVDQTEKLN